MSFNPYAAAIFLPLGFFLFGSQVFNTGALTLYFVGFAALWLGTSILWDWIRFKDKR